MQPTEEFSAKKIDDIDITLPEETAEKISENTFDKISNLRKRRP